MENRFKKDGAQSTFNNERQERSPREARSQGGYFSQRRDDSSRGGTGERRSFNPNFDSEGRVKRDFNRGERREGGFQKREGGSFERREGGNSFNRGERREGGFQKREGGSFERREGGFNRGERREGGFQKREGGSFERREGGFNRGERREGGLQKREGGSFERREGGFNRGERREGGFQKREGGSFERREGGFNRGERREGGFQKREGGSFERREGGFNRGERREGGFQKREGGSFERREGGNSFNRGERREGGFQKREGGSFERREGGFNRDNRSSERGNSYNRGPRTTDFSPRPKRSNSFNRDERPDGGKYTPRTEQYSRPVVEPEYSEPAPIINREIRLNRYIAMSGVCSRREADQYIESGVVSVNGTVVTELGTKIKNGDEIKFEGEVIRGEKKVYVLMNKPKGYVTTLDDPHAEKNIMELLEDKIKERIYPVGRLDKNSLGVLLLTNDGDMARELTHPSFEKKKIYHVFLDKNVSESDLERLAQGVELEDGVAFADEVSYVDGNKSEIGVEIHSGRNRIVRRMFEHLGYRIQKLDRVYFAGLTKKNLKRGMWRFLTPSEVALIKSGKKK